MCGKLSSFLNSSTMQSITRNSLNFLSNSAKCPELKFLVNREEITQLEKKGNFGCRHNRMKWKQWKVERNLAVVLNISSIIRDLFSHCTRRSLQNIRVQTLHCLWRLALLGRPPRRDWVEIKLSRSYICLRHKRTHERTFQFHFM